MGEVYVADDLNLNRKVALKFLPEAFATDPERMARFEREAKLLASLNHPNIAAIHGLEQAVGKRFLVLELVEGETLAQRLSKGALPVDEALGICRQIAEGLEAAHEKGVIHRDLKPANVMITGGDKVKILDFGLAKALSDDAQAVDSSQSPTLTEAMTRPGIILGTAAYMSPEQAKGKAVDKRTDIWAFGCILYECLTGKRSFEGETVTETLAAILKGAPDWQSLPATTPPNIRFALRRCLEKELNRRFHHAADLRIVLEEVRDADEAKAAPVKRPLLAWSVATLAVLVALGLAFSHFFQAEPAPGRPMRFQIALPDKTNLVPGANFALSPDGSRLAFAAIGSDGVKSLWIRALDSLEARSLSGSELSESLVPLFFWSPDSRSIVFHSGGKLKKIDVSGGPSRSLCDIAGRALGGSWNRDGVIILGDFQGSNGLLRVSSAGGVASQLTRPDPSRQETEHSHPTFLPDGRHFVYFRNSTNSANAGVYVGSLDSKPEEQSARQILASAFAPVYVPSQDSGPGQLLFLREQTLMAQQFDDRRLEPIGEPLPVVDQVGFILTTGFFSASTNGILVYRTGGGSASPLSVLQPIWFDRLGKALGSATGEPGLYINVSISPDGKRAAVARIENLQVRSADLYLLDFQRSINTRFTFGKGYNFHPVWSPDGSRIVFASNREGVYNLYLKPVSGIKHEELLLKSSEHKWPYSWSGDGRFLLYSAEDPKTKEDLWVLPMDGNHEPIRLLHTEFRENEGTFSRDMRWIAYVSDESGKNEIWVCAFSPPSGEALPTTGGKWLVSKGGGTNPRWSMNGKELYYLGPDSRPMVVEVAGGTVFQAGTPTLLSPAFPANMQIRRGTGGHSWDVAADGKRFLMIEPVMESSASPFTVVLNWPALLKK
jgi:eukaryotic-like serine/threonine-protein kinase